MLSRPLFRRIGAVVLGNPAPGWSLSRVAAGIALTLTLLGFVAWLADVFLIAAFNTDAADVVLKRLNRRLLLEGSYGLRPASAFVLAFSAGFVFLWVFVGGLAGGLAMIARSRAGTANFASRLRLPLWLMTAATAAWIVWCFIRTAVFYYMRLDIEFELAIYTLLELRSLIASEVLITLGEVPIYIPLAFLLILIAQGLFSLLVLKTAGEFDEAPREAGPAEGLRPFRPALVGGVGVLIAGIVLLSLPAQGFARHKQIADRSQQLDELEGPNPFPEREDVLPRLYEQERFFKQRFGFELPKDTNIVFIVLESAREAFVDLESSEFFRAGPETLRVENFFVPVPHSSNSHYSLFTGLHSERDFEEKYEKMHGGNSLPRLLEKAGYRNYFIYTDHTAFESENLMLEKLGIQVTEKKHLIKRKNPETDDLYAAFQFGMDDIALLHAATKILDENPELKREPFTISLVMTNSHYPYFNPHPEKFNRHNNRTILGRHRNGVDYGMFIADRVVEEFRKRGLDRKTLFVLMSDHGESFGERGFFRHSFSLYNEEVRVPLVLRHSAFSRLARPDDRQLKQGSMLDIFPTVFDMLGLDIPRSLHGRSLFDPEYEFRLPLWVWRLDDYRGLLHGDAKYIYNSVDDELYRLDLHDRLQETWQAPDGYALAFVDNLMGMDYGKAGGVAAAAGDRRGPVVDAAGPYAFGGSFRTGGGRFAFDCSDLPDYLKCLAEADEELPKKRAASGTADSETNSANAAKAEDATDAVDSEEAKRRQRHPELLP